MRPFEITDYTLSAFNMNLEYVDGDYCYEVLCDFQWSDECNNAYIDFNITPLHGTFFHSTTDETGTIEITDEYKQWLQDKVREYRTQTLWLSDECLEKQMDYNTNEIDWCYYGF